MWSWGSVRSGASPRYGNHHAPASARCQVTVLGISWLDVYSNGGADARNAVPVEVLIAGFESQTHETPPGFPGGARYGVVVATYSSWGLTAQVPLALGSLTAVFGMGTGVAFPLTPPQIIGMDACIDSDGRHCEEECC